MSPVHELQLWHLRSFAQLDWRNAGMRRQARNLQSTEAPLSDDRFQKETSTDDCLEGCRTGNEDVSVPLLESLPGAGVPAKPVPQEVLCGAGCNEGCHPTVVEGRMAVSCDRVGPDPGPQCQVRAAKRSRTQTH